VFQFYIRLTVEVTISTIFAVSRMACPYFYAEGSEPEERTRSISCDSGVSGITLDQLDKLNGTRNPVAYSQYLQVGQKFITCP
jgi:hypothetical protein